LHQSASICTFPSEQAGNDEVTQTRKTIRDIDVDSARSSGFDLANLIAANSLSGIEWHSRSRREAIEEMTKA
jgi:hypothetical protein